MLTNLASSYYKIKTKSSTHTVTGIQPNKNLPSSYREKSQFPDSIQKIKIRESVVETDVDDKNDIDEKLFFLVTKSFQNLSDTSRLDSVGDSNDILSTDGDLSVKNDLSYRKELKTKEPKLKKSTFVKKSPKHFDVNKNPIKKHQQCSTDNKILNDTGTNPSNSFLPNLYDVKIRKSSIPVKRQKSSSREIVNSLQKIKFILEEIKELDDEIQVFIGASVDHRDYVYMDEVMIRNLIKLDNLETCNNDLVRVKRKEAIQFIQSSMNRLQKKLLENQSTVLNSDDTLADSSCNVNISERKIRSAIKISREH
ncbi:hypothetical protein RN001_014230 [Aquatica leii]|uniref:BAG domain-containing protein n=1 Tax=Aquatica leii TaxID=1421715 RepID=A0AAN7NX77_9COLE|nr:hypothetical protein RN001_014230 [Aquatica leii]